jgi:primase-polymerase (primpol)-like protein
MNSKQAGANRKPVRPVALAVCPDAIPEQLKAIDQWLVWGYVPDTDQDTGDIDWDKPHVNAHTGGLASVTNAKTWCSFDRAIQVYRHDRRDPATGK